MRKQGILENQAKTVYLGIGSNLGNKQHNIEIAKFKLQSYKIEIIKWEIEIEKRKYNLNFFIAKKSPTKLKIKINFPKTKALYEYHLIKLS